MKMSAPAAGPAVHSSTPCNGINDLEDVVLCRQSAPQFYASMCVVEKGALQPDGPSVDGWTPDYGQTVDHHHHHQQQQQQQQQHVASPSGTSSYTSRQQSTPQNLSVYNNHSLHYNFNMCGQGGNYLRNHHGERGPQIKNLGASNAKLVCKCKLT